MTNFNFRQMKAIEQQNKKRLLNLFPKIPDTSGIYIMTREENGFKYAYIGQAQKILTRMASHLIGYQHIDISIKNHGFYNSENPTGWELIWLNISINQLDEIEKQLISKYANAGFQLRNKTAGGQCEGKVIIDEIRPAKGYHDGLKQGYKNARKYVEKLFEKNLCFTYQNKGMPTKNQEKALQKFEEFLRKEENDGCD